jgi:hypothetical protein
MKIKIIIAMLVFFVYGPLKAQTISGEDNPCPDFYDYTFNGLSCDGNLNWDVIDGTIINTTATGITVRWNKEIIENGRWRVRVQYNPRGVGGKCDPAILYALPVKVKSVSRFSLTGDKVIPGGFRGTKTYTAHINTPAFPATSYLWTTNTGLYVTTTTPTLNLNIDNDDLEWLEVQGRNDACASYGIETRIDITMTSTVSGPDNICTDGIYKIINPGVISLHDASGIATLTDLGNNQWKVERVGAASGQISIANSVSGNIYSKRINVGDVQFTETFLRGPNMAIWGQTHSIEIVPPKGLNQYDLEVGLENNHGRAQLIKIDKFKYKLKVQILASSPDLPPFGPDFIIRARFTNSCGNYEYRRFNIRAANSILPGPGGVD